MDSVMNIVETPTAGLVFEAPPRTGTGLGRETYASFLLLAVTGFTIAGYIGLVLLLVGVVK